MGEKFTSNPVTGSAGLSVPIATSPGRAGVGPDLSINYDSSSGNGPFGFGWQLNLPTITRRTDRGIPRYHDADESDVYVLSGAEDLVPVLIPQGWERRDEFRTVNHVTYQVRRYRPRAEGLFARIERWRNVADPADCCWRTITRDNTTTWYGRSAASRIFDPSDPQRVFTWLPTESHDDKGNVVVFAYKPEDSVGVNVSQVHERNRTQLGRSANRYLKSVRYGNTTPYYPTLPADRPPRPLPDSWLFELVLDYGEHDATAPTPGDAGPWECRVDPFSSHRAGFEIRTYRRCRRTLMFHRFPELGPEPQLVRSTDFSYSVAVFSFLGRVAQTGYRRGADGNYRAKFLPPLELSYRVPTIDPTVRPIERESVENLPQGFEGRRYSWIDVDGQGAAGIIGHHRGGWYFKENLSPANVKTDGNRAPRFGALEAIAQRPSSAEQDGRLTAFLDLAGDGQLDLVQFEPGIAGISERAVDDGWTPFSPFSSFPITDWADRNLRLADLTGDGLADILISAGDHVTWHASLGEDGYGPARTVAFDGDEEHSPRVVFADASESVQLADMSGDGLVDVVRIRNGEVCYWPNLGYGRFGAKVTMDRSPWFDAENLFDQHRLLLADIDGSGTTDLVYLGAEGAQLYFNQSGNSWSPPTTLRSVPSANAVENVAAVDLLGTGTACLVWSSPLARDANEPMKYVDLMGGLKPHLLVGFHNSMGREVRIEYQPSTYFSLLDAQLGRPWATRLPFPVQCVSRVVTVDRVRETVFSTSSTYHEGYFDGVEREFRGFGRVEQLDSEVYTDFVRTGASNVVERELHQQPILTRMWFHTGACLQMQERLLHQYRDQYYRNPQFSEHQLPEPQLPAGLDAREHREGCRALKGLRLRREVYGLDESPAAVHPYSVEEATYRIRLVQPRGLNRHASFLVGAAESISYQYERQPGDPRITHAFVLDTDDVGLVRTSAAVAYPRRQVDAALPASVQDGQARRYVTLSEHRYTGDVEQPDRYRLRAVCDTRGYELHGLSTPASAFVTADELREAAASAVEISYEADPEAGVAKRLVTREQTVFLADDLTSALPLGTLSAHGLTFDTYRLALTAGLATRAFGSAASEADFTNAGYVHRADADWWMPSGRSLYPSDAAAHFFQPSGMRDALGSTTSFERAHDLLVNRVIDELGNATTLDYDYVVLAPRQSTDVNGNRSAVAYDELGVVVRTAAMGKAGASEGDSLADPTTRVEYDLFRWRNQRLPNVVHTFAREVHGQANPRWQEQYSYLDGGGDPVMSKAQAVPGVARRFNEASGTVEEVDTAPALRWIANGRTVFNNKGFPVKQYEPYFSATHEYESARALVEVGVTAVMQYDPLGRNVRADLPDGTFTRVEFDPWRRVDFDQNDTVRESRWYADRGSPDPAAAEPNDPQRRAAWLAAAHAGTATVSHMDTLGRVALVVEDNGGGTVRTTRTEADLTGGSARLFDSRNRLVAETLRNLVGMTVRAESAERGVRRVLTDVVGNIVRAWSDDGRTFRTTYDRLHRPLAVRCSTAEAGPVVLSRVVYGETHPQAQQRNLLGMVYQSFDQAGAVTFERYDFKGNALDVARRFTVAYRSEVDWSPIETLTDIAAISSAADSRLEQERHTGSSTYDALDRPRRVVLPDATVVEPRYDVSNRLASLSAQVRGQGAFQAFLVGQEYDAKGHRQRARLGNGAVTRYERDPLTFRLTGVLTRRETDSDALALQRLTYTYDPVGNVTECTDAAQQTLFFNNAVVAARSRFSYDSLYQLASATGREHAAASQLNHVDAPINSLPHPNNTAAIREYTESYTYDDLGNILAVRHAAGTSGSWTRRYRYGYQSDANNRTNRLLATSEPGDNPAGPYSSTYSYDANGNMLSMPHLASMQWDLLDRLHTVDLSGGGTAFFVAGMAGHRMRKVIERQGGLRVERRHLGAVEIYREYRQNRLHLERQTLHISDESGRIAQVDTKTVGAGGNDPGPVGVPVVRYQYSNHLGSAVLETDGSANVISYEEYHPFGTSAYRAGRPPGGVSLKRYRFAGQERDDETGLYCMGARHYAPWLGRWTSPDPAGPADGPNLFAYCRNNPVGRLDATGTRGERFAELNAAWEQDRASFHATGETTVTRNGLVWQVYTHPTYGRVYHFTGTAPGPNEIIVYGGPLVRPESSVSNREVAPVPDASADAGSAPLPPSSSAGPPAPSRSATPGASTGSPDEDQTGLSAAPGAARQLLEEAARPRSVTGARPTGTLHLWSGTAGKAEARAAIARNGSGWMMGDIQGAPTPEHAAGEAEFARARAAAPGGTLTQQEFERIWGPRSASVVGRGAFSGHPVEAHGTPRPGSIQPTYEWPARAWGGGLRTPFVFGTGMFTAITGGQDRNPAVGISLVTLGVGEATSGLIYGSGAILGSTELMGIGTTGATAFGGAAAAVGFGVASARAFGEGDTAGGVVNALGAAGGIIMVASLFTPVGWVGLVGIGLVAFASGFNLGRWLSR